MKLLDSRQRRKYLWGPLGENRNFLMPFPAFLNGFLCIEQVMNEKEY